MAVFEDSLNAKHEFLLPKFVKTIDIVVQIFSKHVSHARVVLCRAIHEEHCRLNEHDTRRLSIIIANPIEKESLEYPWLDVLVSLLRYEVAYEDIALENVSVKDYFVGWVHINNDVSNDVD